MSDIQEERPLRIFLSAGESSGDALGGRLIATLKEKAGDRPLEIRGIGGPDMAAQGMQSLFPLSELAVMGLLEVLPHIPRLKRRIRESAEAVRHFAPDVLVTIDAPGFNKRLAKALGPTEFPKVHYVAPTVWAWRPKRVHTFKALFDRLLCLMPFEPPYFEAVGLPAPFVGHSVLESGAGEGDGPSFRARHGIDPDQRLLCVMPGSRRSETSRLMPIFQQVAERLAAQGAVDAVTMPVVPHLAESLRAETAAWSLPVYIVLGTQEKYDAMAASNAALASSGTVSLELALARLPMVIAYRLQPLTHFIVIRMVTIPYATLVNHIAQREVIPEYLQTRCTPDLLTPAVAEALDPEKGAAQVADYTPYMSQFAPPGGQRPSEAAAEAVLNAIT